MSLLVAVFNEKSDWSGKTITYEDARHLFIAQDRGPITAQALLAYDAQGQLDWADEGLRRWTQKAALAAGPPFPTGQAAAAPLCGKCGAPLDKASQRCPVCGTRTSAGTLTPPIDAGTSSPSQALAGAQPMQKGSRAVQGAAMAESLDPGPVPTHEYSVPDAAGTRPASASDPGIGVAGFICSLVGLGVPLLGVLGLMLSIAGRRQAQRLGMAKRLSTAGIVIGVISTVLGLLLLVVALLG